MINEVARLFCDALFPRRCPVCGEIVTPKGELVCGECFRKLSFVRQPVCKRCGKELFSESAEFCLDCSKHKRSFLYGRGLLNYDDTAKHSMAQIKYHNKREYLDFYAEAMACKFGKMLDKIGPDALIPVPVHPSRLRQRGFNQAQVLAEKLGSRVGIRVAPKFLVRDKKTEPQKQLDPAQRLRNLEEAFAPGEIDPNVRSAVIVDDIYTTGSTIEACARTLKKAGVRDVYFLTICIGRGD